MLIHLDTGSPVKTSYTDLRNKYPGVSFPSVMTDAQLAQYGLYRVFEDPKPPHNDAHQKLVDTGIVKRGNTWHQTWTITPLADNELDADLDKRLSPVMLSLIDVVAASSGQTPADVITSMKSAHRARRRST